MTKKNKNKLTAALIILVLFGTVYSIIGLICLIGLKMSLVMISMYGIYRLWKMFYEDMDEKDGIL